MWQVFKLMDLGGKIGMIGATIGFLAGMGVAVTIAVLSGRPVAVLLVLAFIAVFIGMARFISRVGFSPAVEARRISLVGTPGSARVLGMKETGMTTQGGLYYLVDFALEVTLPGEQPYQTNIRSMLSRLTMAQFQPGAVVPVKVDPRDRRKVALVEQAGL